MLFDLYFRETKYVFRGSYPLGSLYQLVTGGKTLTKNAKLQEARLMVAQAEVDALLRGVETIEIKPGVRLRLKRQKNGPRVGFEGGVARQRVTFDIEIDLDPAKVEGALTAIDRRARRAHNNRQAQNFADA